MVRAVQVISFLFTLMVGYFMWILIGTPSVANINKCLTTEKYKVYLCEKSANYVRLSQVSPQFRHMILIAEDASFYSHSGFDKDELKKSLSTNLSEKKMARGGSTITQQLAKNVFLPFNKSITRKIREALLTIQLEKILTKDQILEKYVNVIEFGPNIYGIKAAAQHYFYKSPADLNLLESAFLVFLVPNPKAHAQSFRIGQLTPYAKYRILDLIYRMYRFHRISYSQYEEAKAVVSDFPWANLTDSQLNSLSGISGESESSVTPVEDPPEEVEASEEESLPAVEEAPAENAPAEDIPPFEE